MSPRPKTSIVVGAGVFGAAAAVELRQRGWQVTLVDPGPLPHLEASSTDISKAIRMDYGSDRFYTDLALRSLPVWRDWNRRFGEQLFCETGFLVMARGPFDDSGFEADSFRLLGELGQPVERLEARALGQRFPAWKPGAHAEGYYNPQGGWAASSKVVQALVAEAVRSGVELRIGERLDRLHERGSAVDGIVTAGGETLLAEHVIVAAGAWTPALLPQLRPMMSTIGQPVFHFRPDDSRPFAGDRFPVWCADISNTGWYGFPAKPDGIVKVANHGPGQPMDPHAPKVVAPQVESTFREFMSETFEGLAQAPVVTTRLCMYCDTWDGDFWIDHDPERPGLVVACGGSGHAFKFAPLLGPIIADVVERKPNPDTRRFAWRARGTSTSEHARHSGR